MGRAPAPLWAHKARDVKIDSVTVRQNERGMGNVGAPSSVDGGEGEE